MSDFQNFTGLSCNTDWVVGQMAVVVILMSLSLWNWRPKFNLQMQARF